MNGKASSLPFVVQNGLILVVAGLTVAFKSSR